MQTKNTDELFERALKFGATQICPMTTEDDWRIGKLKDPFGKLVTPCKEGNKFEIAVNQK